MSSAGSIPVTAQASAERGVNAGAAGVGSNGLRDCALVMLASATTETAGAAAAAALAIGAVAVRQLPKRCGGERQATQGNARGDNCG